MDKHLLTVFQMHVQTQCEYVLRAADDVNEALKQRDMRRVFFSLQNFLNAAANVSKALWGQKGSWLWNENAYGTASTFLTPRRPAR